MKSTLPLASQSACQQEFANLEELNAFLFRVKKKKAHRLKNLGRELGTKVARQRLAELEREF